MVTIIVSAAVSAAVAVFLSRLQWRREDRYRWAPDRREAYSSFLTAADRWEELDHEAAIQGELEEWFDAPPEDRLEPLMGVHTSSRIRPRANAAASGAFERLADLELIGSATVTVRARTLLEHVRELSGVRYASPPRACGGSSDEHNAATERWMEARQAFIDEVRTELGSD